MVAVSGETNNSDILLNRAKRLVIKVGSALLYLRDFERGIDALERAAENSESKANAYYNLACAYSLNGDSRQALDQLANPE